MERTNIYISDTDEQVMQNLYKQTLTSQFQILSW